jgi:hypothetical protein
MPIQNVGTLLENIVLLEATRLVCHRTRGDGRPVEFANSFAMPPLSAWRDAERYEYQAAFTSSRLARLRKMADVGDPAGYAALLRDCMAQDASRGPNGALLVAALAGRERRALRMWLNDLPDGEGHYTGAVSSLRALGETVRSLFPEATPTLAVTLCETRYPSSIEHLASTLHDWRKEGAPSGRIGFLDPMRYTTASPNGPQTSPADHWTWLRNLLSGLEGPALSVHFTGNSTTSELQQEISALHEDGIAAGFPINLTFTRYHYVVCVNVFHPSGSREAGRSGDELCELVERAWAEWNRLLGGGTKRLRPLNVLTGGPAGTSGAGDGEPDRDTTRTASEDDARCP